MSTQQPLEGPREALLSGGSTTGPYDNVHLSKLSNRVNSQNRIISPTSSANNYPHLRADNSVFASNARKGGYGVMPESYGNLHGRSQSIKNDAPIINKNPATYKSILGSQQASP